MHRNTENHSLIVAALIILPAVALGVAAMMAGGVSPALWGQQAGAWALAALLAIPARRAAVRIGAQVCSALCLLFVIAALFGPEAGGARRWVNLIIFRAHAAQLVLPALLVLLCRVGNPYPALLGAAIVLSLQPDLSQMAAFAAAALAILFRRGDRWLWKAGCLLVLGACLIRCAIVPVAIEPVAYCEGILSMLAALSPALWAAGYAALAAVPAYWLYRFCRQGKTAMLCLAVYYAASLLFAFSGGYPVPFAGFGLSPVVGYYLAHACQPAGEPKAA